MYRLQHNVVKICVLALLSSLLPALANSEPDHPKMSGRVMTETAIMERADTVLEAAPSSRRLKGKKRAAAKAAAESGDTTIMIAVFVFILVIALCQCVSKCCNKSRDGEATSGKTTSGSVPKNSSGEAEADAGNSSSVLCWKLFAPLVVLSAMGLLGLNENQAMCRSRVRDAGLDAVVEVDCDSSSANDGSLVMFTCNIVGQDLTVAYGDWHVNFTGVCLNTTSERALSNGEYKRMSDYADLFGMPPSNSDHVDSASVGSFVVPWEGYLEDVSCNTPVKDEDVEKPALWKKNSHGYYVYETDIVSGKHRVKFEGNDMGEPMVTVLGRNNGGKIEPWQTQSSWLCSNSDYRLGHLREGAVDKDTFFADLDDEEDSLRMGVRGVGFVLLCIGLCCCSGCRRECSLCIRHVVAGCGCVLFIVGVVRVVAKPLPDMFKIDFSNLSHKNPNGVLAIAASLCIFGIIFMCRYLNSSGKRPTAADQVGDNRGQRVTEAIV